MQNRKKRHRFIEQSFGLCGRRRGWDVSREQHRNIGWNRSPAQVGCMRQVLGPGALGRPRGSGSRGRWEGGLGWGPHVDPWLFRFNVWQNSLQIKKNKKKKKAKPENSLLVRTLCFRCWGAEFALWLGNEDPTSHTTCPKKKKSKAKNPMDQRSPGPRTELGGIALGLYHTLFSLHLLGSQVVAPFWLLWIMLLSSLLILIS